MPHGVENRRLTIATHPCPARGARLALLTVALAAACGDAPGAADDDPGGNIDPAEMHDYYRLAVRGDAQSVSDVTLTRVAIAGQVAAMRSADAMAVGYRDGDLVEVAPVHFATTATLDGPAGPVTMSYGSGDAVVYLSAEAGLDRVEVVGADGVATVIDEAELAAVDEDAAWGFRAGTPLSAMPHIVLLHAGDEGELPGGDEEIIEALVEPDPALVDLVEEAFWRMPPPARTGVHTIAFARYHDPMFAAAYARGGLVVFNVDFPPAEWRVFQATAIHEAMHAYQYLLEWTDSPDERWDEAIVEAAEQLKGRHPALGNLEDAWTQLHDTGKGLVTGPYRGDAFADSTPAEALQAGFASVYGGFSPSEDMAEYAASVIAPDWMASDRWYADPCSLMGQPVTVDNGIPFTKITLLRSIDAVAEHDYDACVGGSGLDDPPGIHVPDVISLTQNLIVGWSDIGGANFLSVIAEGPNAYRMLIQIDAPHRQVLGLHDLHNIGFAEIDAQVNGIFLHNDDEDHARTSAGGIALVTEMSPTNARGVLFDVALRNAAGQITDEWPRMTFNAPY